MEASDNTRCSRKVVPKTTKTVAELKQRRTFCSSDTLTNGLNAGWPSFASLEEAAVAEHAGAAANHTGKGASGHAKEAPGDGHAKKAPDDGHAKEAPGDGHAKEAPDSSHIREAVTKQSPAAPKDASKKTVKTTARASPVTKEERKKH